MQKASGIILVLFAVVVLAGCLSHPIENKKQGEETEEVVSLSQEEQKGESVNKELNQDDEVISAQKVEKKYKTVRKEKMKHAEIPEEFPSNIPIPQEAEMKEILKIPKAEGEIINLHYYMPGQEAKKYNELYTRFLEDVGADVQRGAEEEHFYQVTGKLTEGNSLHVTVVEKKDLTNVLLVYGDLFKE